MAKRHVVRAFDWGSLLFRLEELVMANSGQDAFEEVFKLLVAKFASETLPDATCEFAAAAAPQGTTKLVNGLLKAADTVWPGLVSEPFTCLADSHLSICVGLLSGHRLCNASLEVLDAAFEHLVSVSSKGNKGQFFTPRHVVDLCVRMVKPKPNELLCDPSCGSGAFLVHSHTYMASNFSAYNASRNGQCLWGFDFDQRTIRVAKALCLFAGIPNANLAQVNSLLNPKMQVDLFASSSGGESLLTVEDIVETKGIDRRSGVFDVILTNPPFAGEIREARLLDSYELHRDSRRSERDVLFIERCVNLLKPGGRIAIVLPHNKVGGDGFAYVREWLVERLCVIAVVGLGRSTFLPHTHQKTSILFGYKRRKPQRKIAAEPIFFAVSEKEGKDTRGRYVWRTDRSEDDSVWSRADHDFDGILSAFEREYLPLCPEWNTHAAV